MNTGQQVQSPIQDHGGPIRAITKVSGVDGYATCSNDGTVILRDSNGHAIGTMFHPPQEDGSPPFILDICQLDTSTGLDTVSCGEDGSVCVWQGTELLQCIPHPSSVWCAYGIPSDSKHGDFVTCSHDGILRLFSRRHVSNQSQANEDRIQALQINFKQQVEEAMQRRRKGPSQEEINKAAKWNDRGDHPGKSEGQVYIR